MASKAKRFMWSKHPEETAWLAEYCARCHDLQKSIDAFQERFGIRLTADQVRGFRQARGIKKPGTRGKTKEVGAEILRDGYVYVKVSNTNCYRDDWKPKTVIEWERANGRPLPEGYKVMFLDGDKTNYDPDNLYAVSKANSAHLGRLLGSGATYSNREELEALLAIGQLETAITDAKNRPRPCRVCGRMFTPDHRYNVNKACRACLDSGKRASSWESRKTVGRGVCIKCGKEFGKHFENQRRCQECSAKRAGRKRYQKWSKGRKS